MSKKFLPKIDLSNAPSGCCPKFNPKDWDQQEFIFKDKLFLRGYTRSIFHIPLNIGPVTVRMWETVQKNKAEGDWLMMSRDLSAWKAEQLLAISKQIPGEDVVKISGKFLTKVFEGPYQEAKNWYYQMQDYAKENGEIPIKVYFFYTTCPKCVKFYGKNYVVGLVQVK